MPSTRPAAKMRRRAALSFVRSFVMPTMLLNVLIAVLPLSISWHQARSALESLPPLVGAIFTSVYGSLHREPRFGWVRRRGNPWRAAERPDEHDRDAEHRGPARVSGRR